MRMKVEFSIHLDRVEVEVNTKLLGPVCTDLLIEASKLGNMRLPNYFLIKKATNNNITNKSIINQRSCVIFDYDIISPTNNGE